MKKSLLRLTCKCLGWNPPKGVYFMETSDNPSYSPEFASPVTLLPISLILVPPYIKAPYFTNQLESHISDAHIALFFSQRWLYN